VCDLETSRMGALYIYIYIYIYIYMCDISRLRVKDVVINIVSSSLSALNSSTTAFLSHRTVVWQV